MVQNVVSQALRVPDRTTEKMSRMTVWGPRRKGRTMRDRAGLGWLLKLRAPTSSSAHCSLRPHQWAGKRKNLKLKVQPVEVPDLGLLCPQCSVGTHGQSWWEPWGLGEHGAIGKFSPAQGLSWTPREARIERARIYISGGGGGRKCPKPGA